MLLWFKNCNDGIDIQKESDRNALISLDAEEQQNCSVAKDTQPYLKEKPKGSSMNPSVPSKRNIFPKSAARKYSPYQDHSNAFEKIVAPVDILRLANSDDPNFNNNRQYLSRSNSMPGRLGNSARLSAASSSDKRIDVHSPIDLSMHLPWLCKSPKSPSLKVNRGTPSPASAVSMPDLESTASENSSSSLSLQSSADGGCSDAVNIDLKKQEKSTFGFKLKLRSTRKSNPDSEILDSSSTSESSTLLRPKSILRQSSFSSNSFSSSSDLHKRSKQQEIHPIIPCSYDRIIFGASNKPIQPVSGNNCVQASPARPCLSSRSQSMSSLNKVSFSSRVNVLEFRRTLEEQKKSNRLGWFSAEELESFKNDAIDEIQRLRARKSIQNMTNGSRSSLRTSLVASYASSYESPESIELSLEVQDILIVDCHDVFLKLLSKYIIELIPHANVTTALSSREALRRITEAKKGKNGVRCDYGFDIIIVEERLKSQKYGSSSRYSLSQDQGASSSPASVTDVYEIRQQEQNSGSHLVSYLVQNERSSDIDSRCCASLLIGMSAFPHCDADKLREAGVDMVWGKPPPKITSQTLVEALLRKRGKCR